MAKRLFEIRVINPILNTIKNNLDYLTLSENLPQLAKLGFMYNTLWYAGRVAYGFDGVVKKGKECEDNPKYKLEMCDVGTEEQYDLVYDAWGMHVENGLYGKGYDAFKSTILDGKAYTELELLERKPNKTMDEFVKLYMNKNYRYNSLFESVESVHNYLLCVIGTTMEYNKETGFIYQGAGGADQDSAGYGEWENAKFPTHIQKVVDKVLADEGVEIVLREEKVIRDAYAKKKQDEELKDRNELSVVKRLIVDARVQEILDADDERLERFKRGYTTEDKLRGVVGDYYLDKEALREEVESELNDELSSRRKKIFEAEAEAEEEEEEEAFDYYDICGYSNITKLDEKTHPSYLKAAIKICDDILENAFHKRKQPASNYEFAMKNRTRLQCHLDGVQYGMTDAELKDLTKFLDKDKKN